MPAGDIIQCRCNRLRACLALVTFLSRSCPSWRARKKKLGTLLDGRERSNASDIIGVAARYCTVPGTAVPSVQAALDLDDVDRRPGSMLCRQLSGGRWDNGRGNKCVCCAMHLRAYEHEHAPPTPSPTVSRGLLDTCRFALIVLYRTVM